MFYKLEENIHAFFTWGTDKSEQLDSNSDSFTTQIAFYGTHRRGGWVDESGAGMDALNNIEISLSVGN